MLGRILDYWIICCGIGPYKPYKPYKAHKTTYIIEDRSLYSILVSLFLRNIVREKER